MKEEEGQKMGCWWRGKTFLLAVNPNRAKPCLFQEDLRLDLLRAANLVGGKEEADRSEL